jgi:hypothetical protein
VLTSRDRRGFKSTQDVASPTAMAPTSYCKEYQPEACCSADVAAGYAPTRRIVLPNSGNH